MWKMLYIADKIRYDIRSRISRRIPYEQKETQQNYLLGFDDPVQQRFCGERHFAAALCGQYL
jgi:hypothetical protein